MLYQEILSAASILGLSRGELLKLAREVTHDLSLIRLEHLTGEQCSALLDSLRALRELDKSVSETCVAV